MPEEVPDEVPDDCIVYRMVRRDELKPNGQYNSPNFTDKEGYMSVNFEDEMRAAGKTADDLEEHWGPAYEAVSFIAGDLRKMGEKVWRVPVEDFPGHGGVKRADDSKRTVSQKRDLAKEAKRRNR